jgi:hypothetical protein
MLHRHWRINNLRIQRAKKMEEYSNEAHLSAVLAAIQYSETLLQSLKMMKSLTMKTKMRKMTIHAFRTLQRPPSSQKIFLECFLTVQLSTGRLKCVMILGFVVVHVQSIPVHGGITRTFLFIMIMDARQLP